MTIFPSFHHKFRFIGSLVQYHEGEHEAGHEGVGPPLVEATAAAGGVGEVPGQDQPGVGQVHPGWQAPTDQSLGNDTCVGVGMDGD